MGGLVGGVEEDVPVLIDEGRGYTLVPVGGLTHYLGDAVALVAAEDRETLEKAKSLIRVEYEVLPPVRNIREAAEGPERIVT